MIQQALEEIVWKWRSVWDWFVDSTIRMLCLALPGRFRIVPEASTGEPMLRQLAIIRGGSWIGKRVGALYLQHFDAPEPRGYAHIHRWRRMRSLVLSGSFIEERPIDVEYIAHMRGDRYEMDRKVIHRVEWWSPRCWTLFHMSVEQSDAWGWFEIANRDSSTRQRVLGCFIPWRKHIAKRVPSLDTREITQ